MLHRLGFVYKKTKVVPGKFDPKKQAFFLNGYKAIKGCKIPRIEFISLTRLIPNITQCPHKIGLTQLQKKQATGTIYAIVDNAPYNHNRELKAIRLSTTLNLL